MLNAKSIGWAIYTSGFVIWLFGYLSAGHAPVFDWHAATPWWISSLVPNLEAELGLTLMFASMIPIYWPARRKRALTRSATTAPRPDLGSRWSARQVATTSIAFVTLLVFGAVTLAWWWFLAWLIWRVI
jgi:hypothetical protein